MFKIRQPQNKPQELNYHFCFPKEIGRNRSTYPLPLNFTLFLNTLRNVCSLSKAKMDSTTEHITHGEKGRLELEIQDDEELFDIDLDLVDSIPLPNYYWESYILSTGTALLANCLLPVTHLSTAIPVNSGEPYLWQRCRCRCRCLENRMSFSVCKAGK